MTDKRPRGDLLTAAMDAARFLTRLPFLGARRAPGAEEEPGAAGPPMHPWTMAFFPVVGLFLGAVLWTLVSLLGLMFPKAVVDVVALALLAILTGGIHWDGLMDTADALGAPRDRRAEVLRDVHVGSYGLLALVFVAGVQWAGLFSQSGWMHGADLLLFPVWGRWAMVAVTLNMTDIRNGQGLAGAFISQLEIRHLLWATAFAFVCSVLLLGVLRGAMLMVGLGAATWGLRRWFHHAFGGVTGDLIGAACCLGEAVALLLLATAP